MIHNRSFGSYFSKKSMLDFFYLYLRKSLVTTDTVSCLRWTLMTWDDPRNIDTIGHSMLTIFLVGITVGISKLSIKSISNKL